MSNISFFKRWGLRAGVASSAWVLMSCGVKEESELAVPLAPKEVTMVGAAESLGFAAMLPADTTMYIGTVGMGAHLEALEKSAYGRRWMAFAEDQIPVSDEMNEAQAMLQDVTDGFVALGVGGMEFAKWLRKASELYDQVTYRTLFAGGLASAMGGTSAPTDFMLSALSDEALVDLAMLRLDEMQFPPLMMGVKVAKPDELLALLMKEETLVPILKEAERSALKTPCGGEFTVFHVEYSKLIDEKSRKQMIKKMKDPEHKRVVERALDLVEGKTGEVAIGKVGGYVVVTVGQDLSQLESLVEDPSQSLLSKPEWKAAAPHAEKPVMGLVYMEDDLMDSLNTEEPLTPMLEGLLVGLKESEMFGVVAERVEPMVEELRTREREVFSYDWSNLAMVLWWEDGVRGLATGGWQEKGADLEKPLALAGLLEDPFLLYGSVGHGSSAGAGRAYFESWMKLLYTIAGEGAEMGLYGEQGPVMLQMVNEQVVPGLLGAYEASETLYREGLDSESAFVLNVGGKLPPLPGVPADGKLPMLRMAGVHKVKDRALVAQSWTAMETDLRTMLGAIPSPIPLALPDAMSSDKNGVTTYFYALPFLAEDLMPCASINDDLFMLGTSKALNESLAAQMAESTVDTTIMGSRSKVGFKAMRLVMDVLEKQTPEENKPAMKEAQEALQPFGDLEMSQMLENGELISRIDWEIRDLKQVD